MMKSKKIMSVLLVLLMVFGVAVPLLATQPNPRGGYEPFLENRYPVASDYVSISAAEEALMYMQMEQARYLAVTGQCIVENMLMDMGYDSLESFMERNPSNATEYEGNYMVHFAADGGIHGISADTNERIDFNFDLEPDAREVHRRTILQALRAPHTFYDDNILSLHENAFNEMNVSPFHEGIRDGRAFPYRATVRLDVTWPSGITTIASGFLIREDLVLTSGHNLYSQDPRRGGMPRFSNVRVTPGRAWGQEPFGHRYASNWWIGGTWLDDFNPDQDYAIIQLTSRINNIPAPNRFVPVATDHMNLINRQVFTAGQNPGFGNDLMRFGPRPIRRLAPESWREFEFYLARYEIAPGFSGAPIYNSQHQVYGIISRRLEPRDTPYPDNIRAVRMLQYLVSWMNWLMTQV